MARILWVVVGIPVGIVFIALGVANRAPVTISLDPFRPDASVLSVHPPLFLAFFAVLAAGVILGGVAVWLSQHKHRRALHRAREEVARLRQEREQLLAERPAGQPALPSPRRAA